MSLTLDEQAARVAGLLTVTAGAAWEAPRRFKTGYAWLAQRGAERLVLKLGRSEQDAADVAWEHDFLTRLAATGFPASAPVPAFDGQSWVEADGRLWSAMTYLPGRPLATEPDPNMEAAGAFLAQFHRAAGSTPLPAQRPTAAELSQLWETMHWQNLRTALGDVGKLGQLVAMLHNLEVDLRHLKYAKLKHVVIHGDPTNDNLIVDGTLPRVVGLIDFGSAHVSPWPVDLAAALWRSGRPDPDTIEYDLARVGRFVAGYHRESPIPPEIARAIPLLMVGRGLQLISRRVRRLPRGRPPGPMPAVALTLARTEWIRAHRGELAHAIEVDRAR